MPQSEKIDSSGHAIAIFFVLASHLGESWKSDFLRQNQNDIETRLITKKTIWRFYSHALALKGPMRNAFPVAEEVDHRINRVCAELKDCYQEAIIKRNLNRHALNKFAKDAASLAVELTFKANQEHSNTRCLKLNTARLCLDAVRRSLDILSINQVLGTIEKFPDGMLVPPRLGNEQGNDEGEVLNFIAFPIVKYAEAASEATLSQVNWFQNFRAEKAFFVAMQETGEALSKSIKAAPKLTRRSL